MPDSASLSLKSIDNSLLYQRRVKEVDRPTRLVGELFCHRCGDSFLIDEVFVLEGDRRWHTDCFRCSQCFCELADALYFIEGDRFYCEHDYRTLYAPVCVKCKEDVIGAVVRAATGNYHAYCFRCEECERSLEYGVWIVDSRLLCYDCKENIPREARYICHKCHQTIERDQVVHHNGDVFHAYHFDCAKCGVNLDVNLRSINNQLYCLRCYDLQCDICAGCKTPIEKETQHSIEAAGRHWHIGHFRCNHCGDSLHRKEFHERRDKVYCRRDYLKLFGDHCFKCGAGLSGDSIRIFGKGWCPDCYSCIACERRLRIKDKVMELDMRPLCKTCMGVKRVRKMLEEREKRGKDK